VALPRQLREDERLAPEEVEVLESHAGDLLKWLEKHRGAFFAGEGYAKAAPEHAAAREALLARKRSSEKHLDWAGIYAAE
jgi:hypothetical protein